jgi:hypothetical protein
MEKEFVTYEQALKLKELGFDEPCLSHYKNDTLSDFFEIVKNSEIRNVNNEVDDYISAPLKQQVFRWFRDVWGYHVSIRKRYYHDAETEYNYFIYPPNSNEHLEHNLLDEYDSWEEAESYCIDDLIQIITTGNNI